MDTARATFEYSAIKTKLQAIKSQFSVIFNSALPILMTIS